MATYITLARYTQQGISKVKESPNRVDAYRKAVQGAGGSLKGFYLTLGRYDIVVITEAPDDTAVARARSAASSVLVSMNRRYQAASRSGGRAVVDSGASGKRSGWPRVSRETNASP